MWTGCPVLAARTSGTSGRADKVPLRHFSKKAGGSAVTRGAAKAAPSQSHMLP